MEIFKEKEIHEILISLDHTFQQMSVQNHLLASVYYLSLLLKFPTSFESIIKFAKKYVRIPDSGRKGEYPLRTARTSLLKKGVIAQLLLGDEKIRGTKEEKYTERFIPISPSLLLRSHEALLKSDLYTSLIDVHRERFGRFGVVIEKGCLTLLHSAEWITNFLMSVAEGDDILMRVSGLKMLRRPYLQNLEELMRRGCSVRMLLTSREVDIKELERLKKEFPDRFFPKVHTIETYTTTKLIILGERAAIDGRKIIGIKEPCYISTVYLSKDVIEQLKERFKVLWELGERVI